MSKPGYEVLYNQDDSALFFWRKDKPIGPEHVDQMVDDQPVGPPAEVADGPTGEIRSCIATFPLPHGLVRDSFNEIVLHSEGATAGVLGLEACFELPETLNP